MNIKDFINLKELCPFCNNKMCLGISKSWHYTTNLIDDTLLIKENLNNFSQILIHIETNKILSDLDIAQKFIWKRSIELGLECVNEFCSGFYCISTLPIAIEIKAQSIYSLKIKNEVLAVNINDTEYGLVNDYNRTNTTKLVTIGEVLREFPLININRMNGEQFISNKIKTMLTFS